MVWGTRLFLIYIINAGRGKIRNQCFYGGLGREIPTSHQQARVGWVYWNWASLADCSVGLCLTAAMVRDNILIFIFFKEQGTSQDDQNQKSQRSNDWQSNSTFQILYSEASDLCRIRTSWEWPSLLLILCMLYGYVRLFLKMFLIWCSLISVFQLE